MSEEVEEITTEERPQRVVRKVTKTEPVDTESPQRVYEKKKAIFRSNQVVWYILGIIEVLLAFRFILKVLGANPFSPFTNFIYTITYPLIAPFNGILGVSSTATSTIEWSVFIAAAVYVCIAWALIYLLDLFFPITPHDVAV